MSTTLAVLADEITPLIEADQYELFELVGPLDSGPPPHAHAWDEGYLILEGEVVIGNELGETTLHVGDRYNAPAGQVHWFRIASDRARFLVSTGGKKAGMFFRDMAASVPAGAPTPESLPTIIEVAKRNGLTSPLF